MKHFRMWFAAILMVFLILPGSSIAQTVYVSEKFEITLRTGPGTDRKIIFLINSGTPLEILEKGSEWSRIKEPGGREGWVLNRYLTPNPPCFMAFEKLQQEYDTVVASHNALKAEFQILDEQKKIIDTDLSRERQENSEVHAAYETLQQDCANYIDLSQRYDALEKELEAEKTHSAKLYEENVKMKQSTIILWCLTGSGIMLAGFLMGFLSARQRKQRSSIY